MDKTRTWDERLILFVATGGGVGLIPKAPGTFGSLAALPLIFALKWLPLPAYVLTAAVLAVVGIPICGKAARSLRIGDPGCVVFDELVGMLWTFAWVPFHWLNAITAFVLFRILDITKPPPVRTVERLPGGLGIMADDVLAGMIAGALLWGLNRSELWSSWIK